MNVVRAIERNRKLRTSEPLEEHANSVYTRGMYERFDWEMYRSGKFRIKERQSPTEFVLIHNKMKDEEEAYKFHVRLHDDECMECTCGLYEHMGMICRHAIKEIPRRNILGRWTKVWDGDEPHNQLHGMEICTEEDKRRMLINNAIELANKLTTVEERTQGQPHNERAAGQDILLSSDQITRVHTKGFRFSDLLKESHRIPVPYKGGKPPNTGLKSWLASVKKQDSKSTTQASQEPTDWPYEENPATRKKRLISEIGSI